VASLPVVRAFAASARDMTYDEGVVVATAEGTQYLIREDKGSVDEDELPEMLHAEALRRKYFALKALVERAELRDSVMIPTALVREALDG